MKVRIGEWKINTDPDCEEDDSAESCDTTADILPKSVIIHEDYRKNNQSTYKNDIAIIELGWPPRRSELINVIKLAEPSRCYEHVCGEKWKTTGFGRSNELFCIY